MDFEKVYLGRRSKRKYLDKELPLSLVGEILELATFAPSSGNIQNWKFVVVTEQALKQRIADSCLDQAWMVDAPVHVVVCNDYNLVKDHYGKLGRMFSIQNCSNVAFGIMLAAYNKGVSSCWVGAFDNDAIQKALGIPEHVDPEIIITLGYSNETKKPSLRRDLNNNTFINQWSTKFITFPSPLERLNQLIKKQTKKFNKK